MGDQSGGNSGSIKNMMESKTFKLFFSLWEIGHGNYLYRSRTQ